MSKKAKNGQGSVYFDKSKNGYRARITDINGKIISKRFNNKDDAERWLVVTRANMMTGNYVAPNDVTLGEWVAEFIEVYCKPNIRLKTYVGYLQTANHISPIADIPLQNVETRQIQNLINRLKIASSTRHKVYRLLKASFNRAMMLDLIKKNVMLAVRPPKLEPHIIQVFTPDELNTILDYLKQYPRWYALVRLATETGMRLGEILGLKTYNIKDNTIYIECSLSDVLGKPQEELPKTKSGYRHLPITPDLRRLLASVAGAEYVFNTVSGNSIRATNVERMWRNTLSELNIPFRNFHVLRHTFATSLLAKGVPLNDVSAYLGHSKPSHTLNLYGHAVPSRTAEIPNIIDGLLHRCSTKA